MVLYLRRLRDCPSLALRGNRPGHKAQSVCSPQLLAMIMTSIGISGSEKLILKVVPAGREEEKSSSQF